MDGVALLDLHGPVIREIEERHLLAILHADARADICCLHCAARLPPTSSYTVIRSVIAQDS